MAKVIKFNLICDGNPVRKIEDLQENFSLEDMLSYFENRQLHKWLEVRGFNNELEKVNTISTHDSFEVLKSLAEIFEIDEDPATLEEKIKILNYERDKRLSLDRNQDANIAYNNTINNYFGRYDQLVNEIFENHWDIRKIKSNLDLIKRDFYNIYFRNYFNLLELFAYRAPLAFVLILNESSLYKNTMSSHGYNSFYEYNDFHKVEKVKKIFENDYDEIIKTLLYRGTSSEKWIFEYLFLIAKDELEKLKDIVI